MMIEHIDVMEVERRAHEMRAQAIRNGSKALAGWVRSHVGFRRPTTARG